MRSSRRAWTDGVEAAGVTGDDDLPGDGVASAVGAKVGAGQHCWLEPGRRFSPRRSAGPGRSRRPTTSGSTTICGRAAWPPAADDPDLEVVLARHDRAGCGCAGVPPAGPGGCAGRRARRSESGRAGRRRASPARPVPAPRPAGRSTRTVPSKSGAVGESRRSAEHHRHVAVVSAGVHRARGAGGVRLGRRLVQRQGVQVGAQPDRAIRTCPGSASRRRPCRRRHAPPRSRGSAARRRRTSPVACSAKANSGCWCRWWRHRRTRWSRSSSVTAGGPRC